MTEARNPLFAAILALLTPILGIGGLAAARQALAAYHPAADDQLISAAQIAGFTLTSLDSLGLSMPETLPLPLKLRLRGNANALARCAAKATAALQAQRRPAVSERPIPARMPAARAGAPAPTDPSDGRSRDASWANAMTNVAAEFTAELATMPLAQRQIHQRRIGALRDMAGALNRGDVPPLQSRGLGQASRLPG